MATPIPANDCSLTAAEIIRAAKATYTGDPHLNIAGVSVDSRQIKSGQLFVALRGTHDGHAFLEDAAKLEAAAALVERGRASDHLPCFEVDDTLAALGQLAAYHLERTRAGHALPVIAVGGAAGKTSTKELTAAVARALFGPVLATTGNLNNLIGVPMTLFTLAAADRAAVIECGTDQAGEIARLAQIVRPDVALVLNADVEHTEGLGSLEGVADEEAALFGTAQAAVTGSEEKMLLERIPKGMRTVTFGASATADVRLLSRMVIAPGRQRISLALSDAMIEPELQSGDGHADQEQAAGPLLDFPLDLLGAASALNAAAAVAAVAAAHGRPLSRAQLTAIAAALETVEPVPGRLNAREAGEVVVIDDTYNANPRSVRVALEAARETADGLKTRLIVALGDMLELGALAPAMHVEALHAIIQSNLAICVLVGPELAAAARTVASIPGSGYDPNKIAFARNSTAAVHVVRSLVRPKDVLLVKGSRGIAMEKIIDGLSP